MGKVPTPPARSKAPARRNKFSAREPGDLQLALPGMESGEHAREPQKGARRVRKREKSDRPIVSKKPTNKAKAAESVERRGLAKGKVAQGNPHRIQGRTYGGATGLRRLRERARRNPKEKFSNLFTHLRVDVLRAVFYRLKRQASPGVDGQSWADYEQGLDDRLVKLQDRLHRGAYRPAPVRRTYIPKADGRQRPLGIPTIEDKVVQGAVVAVLTPIYEAEFLDCSYAFRPRRNQHMALKAVDGMMYRGRVNWVLDLDIRGYFDAIDHEWLVRMLEHRIGDRRLIRLIRRWLKAGVLEDERVQATTQGTPQGGLISPLLANVYLHYVLDLWFRKETRRLRGTASMVRYADDVIIGAQHHGELLRLRELLERRFRDFGLEMHPEKTRIVRFGMFARRDSHLDGRSRPETFDFLGFTHICSVSRKGKFWVLRRTSRKKLKTKRAEIRERLRSRMHWPVPIQWRWLCAVLRGHFAYYSTPGNYRALASFRRWVRHRWYATLRRRSQRSRLTRARLNRLDKSFPLPKPRIIRRSAQPALSL